VRVQADPLKGACHCCPVQRSRSTCVQAAPRDVTVGHAFQKASPDSDPKVKAGRRSVAKQTSSLCSPEQATLVNMFCVY
jgi:hypothetical protein